MYGDAKHTRRGVALLAAVALLALFSMLGISYIRFMSIEGERARWQARNVRAEVLAGDYLRVALHEVEAMLANGARVPDEIAYPIVPTYLGGRGGPESLVDSESLRAEVRVRIADEAAKVDINRASPGLITAVTGLDSDTAQRVYANTRPPLAREHGDAFPIRNLEELAVRGVLDLGVITALPREWLTVYSGPSGPFLNANTMPPQLLAATLEADDDTVADIMAARPFETREDLRAAMGDDAVLHPSVGVGSRCYRLTCEVTISQPAADDTWRPVRTQRLEAVVAYLADGPRVLYWGPASMPEDEEPVS